MLLAIDTSCDDTSVAVLRGDGAVVVSLVSSQFSIHAPHGGVVPELASRSHAEILPAIVDRALMQAGCTLDDITAMAVTYTPGLLGCLLVGVNFAKALAHRRNLPLYTVHHLEGHLFSPYIGDCISYPFLGLVVSGGHTAFYRVDGPHEISTLGQTVDDAVGEVYDKIAKVLGLGYPGGPAVDKLAAHGNPHALKLTIPRVKMGEEYLSFSGIKTAVFQAILNRTLSSSEINDVCASLQEMLVGILCEKARYFLDRENLPRLAVSGGVAMNSLLRKRFQMNFADVEVKLAAPEYCTDNAAMIGFAALIKGERADPLTLNAVATQKIQARSLRREQKGRA